MLQVTSILVALFAALRGALQQIKVLSIGPLALLM